MATNRIVKSEIISTITKGGKTIALGVATETQEWKRLAEIARALEPAFKNAVVSESVTLPAGTAELIQGSVSAPLLSCVTKTHRCAVKVSISALPTRKNTGRPLHETRIINTSRPFTCQNRNRHIALSRVTC